MMAQGRALVGCCCAAMLFVAAAAAVRGEEPLVPAEVLDEVRYFCTPREPDALWSASADWLYWSVRQTELDFAVPVNDFTSIVAIGDVHIVEPDFNHGFRVDLERLAGCGSVDVQYTFFRSDESASATDPVNLSGTRLPSNVFLEGTLGGIDLAQADWELQYHVLDVNGGYYVLLGRRFQGKLLAGLKLVSIDQEFDILYSQTTTVNGATNRVALVDHQTKMSGIGANVGLNGRFAVTERIKLVGQLMYSPIIADFDQEFFAVGSTNGLATRSTIADLDQDSRRLVSVIDLRLGIETTLYSTADREATLNIGYQFQHWLNYPAFLTYDDGDNVASIGLAEVNTFDRHDANLSFDGLYVGGTFRF